MGWINAWRLEYKRLTRRGGSSVSYRNEVLIWQLIQIAVLVSIYFFLGLTTLLCFIIASFLSIFILEAINYIEHYGLVRAPGSPVRSAHSWNSNHYLSSIYLCNVTRHSSHHEKSSLKYWELNPYQNAPKTLYGYLSTLYLVLLFPWLYRLLMKKKLAYWDNNFASQRELDIIRNLDANPY